MRQRRVTNKTGLVFNRLYVSDAIIMGIILSN